jgi:hypothetical protein
VTLAGFATVEIADLDFALDDGTVLTLQNCREVIVDSLAATRAPSERPMLHIGRARSATVNGCQITTKLPGVAVVFDDADAVTRFTDNDVRGVVSFYGVPVESPRPPDQKLIESLRRDGITIQEARGSLLIARNHLEVLTVGRSKMAELNEFASQTRNSLVDLFATVAFSDNSVTTDRTTFLGKTISITGLTLAFNNPANPLGMFVGSSATVVGTVFNQPTDAPLDVLTLPRRCADAGNLTPIRKTA